MNPTTIDKPRTAKPVLDDAVCHLTRDRETAVCGAAVEPGEHPGPMEFRGHLTCPIHGKPICPTCKAIIETWRRSGGWEGV